MTWITMLKKENGIYRYHYTCPHCGETFSVPHSDIPRDKKEIHYFKYTKEHHSFCGKCGRKNVKEN